MQALALLCTLHADGPATLRRLQSAGCKTLQELDAYEPDDLARLLDVPPSVARRLGREARSLADRLDIGAEADGAQPAGTSLHGPVEQAGTFGDREESPAMASPTGAFEAPVDAPSDSVLQSQDRAVLNKVLERWAETPEPETLAASSETGVTQQAT